jgi:hypothetical protein
MAAVQPQPVEWKVAVCDMGQLTLWNRHSLVLVESAVG